MKECLSHRGSQRGTKSRSSLFCGKEEAEPYELVKKIQILSDSIDVLQFYGT